jgi:uncharacterized protein YegJ (DUF2314 family)
MGWLQKSMPIAGSVLFRGSLPPKLSDLRMPPGATVTPRTTGANAHWVADATSPALGHAELICLRDPPAVPKELVAFDNALTAAEKADVALGRSLVTVRIGQSKGHLLRDRKRLLTWLGALFDDDAVIALDHASTRPWSRGMLDDELAHDADVDVTALYAVHAISDAEGERCEWLHTHGLAELGKVDFDILRPAEALTSNAADLIRALAFAVLEDRLKVGTPDFVAFQPGGTVAAVDARAFDAAAPADERAIRDMGDDSHATNRIVLADPSKRGFVGRFFGGGKGVRAARALTNFPDDRAIVFFGHDASALAAERARKTWSQFRAIQHEFADLRFPAIVKLGYRVDGGGETDLEHLWFEVHDADAEMVEATLMNEPFQIRAMQAGQRGRHTVMELLSDWMLMTPLGAVTPRTASALRVLRSNPEVRAKVREIIANTEANG